MDAGLVVVMNSTNIDRILWSTTHTFNHWSINVCIIRLMINSLYPSHTSITHDEILHSLIMHFTHTLVYQWCMHVFAHSPNMLCVYVYECSTIHTYIHRCIHQVVKLCMNQSIQYFMYICVQNSVMCNTAIHSWCISRMRVLLHSVSHMCISHYLLIRFAFLLINNGAMLYLCHIYSLQCVQ